MCVSQDLDSNDFNVRFESASRAEIDDAYDDLYGYDEYYYNMQDDDDDSQQKLDKKYSEYSEGSQDGNYYDNVGFRRY